MTPFKLHRHCYLTNQFKTYLMWGAIHLSGVQWVNEDKISCRHDDKGLYSGPCVNGMNLDKLF